jgi:glycolate oxidase iron-sulfur subunit
MSTENIQLKTALNQESERLLACVHCGLCLPTCPTYRQLGNENDSPRGRLYLMRAVAEERLVPTDKYNQHLDLCLGCRACETVCPSGVPFGHLLEAARADLVAQPPPNLSLQVVRRWALTRFMLEQVFTRPRLMAVLWAMVRVLQRSPIVSMINRLKLLQYTPGYFPLLLLENARSNLGLAAAWRQLTQLAGQSVLPGNQLASDKIEVNKVVVNKAAANKTAANEVAANKVAEANGNCTVAQFQGCIMEGLFRETNQATTRVLRRFGVKVTLPVGQGCCGALQAHAGLRDVAVQLAKANVDAFVPVDALLTKQPIIVNAAGCGAMLKNYGELLHDQPDYAERARHFSQQVQDVSEFLVTCPLPATDPLPLKVTYDAPCHLYHGQGVRQAPLQLLQAIKGVEFVPLIGSEQCCGSAGTYNINHPEMARKLLAEKLQAIDQTQAQVVVTGNPGCAMQLAAGLQAAERSVLVLHLVELLDLAQTNRGDRVAPTATLTAEH